MRTAHSNQSPVVLDHRQAGELEMLAIRTAPPLVRLHETQGVGRHRAPKCHVHSL
jgi:hypothetical protein